MRISGGEEVEKGGLGFGPELEPRRRQVRGKRKKEGGG